MKKGPVFSFGRLRAPQACSFLCIVLFLAFSSASSIAQRTGNTGVMPARSASLPNAPLPQPGSFDAVTVRDTPRHVLEDQKAIWTSPLHVRRHDLVWLLPLAAATGVALATDQHTMSSVVSHDKTFNDNNVTASNVMLGSLFAVPLLELSYGHFANNDHERESGILGAESVVDAAAIEQGMKLIFWRERPYVDNANGRFWQSSVGIDSSFPSSHTVFAWSTAAIIAGEHPSPWSQFTVYTLATGVSLTRVLGQEHFPTDALVGSAAGWLAGHYIYKVRHRWHAHIR